MQHQSFSHDEHMAATAVASLATSKRGRGDEDVEMRDCKMARVETQPVKHVKKAPVIRVLRPAPFFFYKDFSQVPDPDPLTPLTAPGRVPNFPAKMHAILSRGELRGIVAWQPHGRSWRVLKPREFEIKVLPKFFEHAKFSSFVRQANGWGFRRITTQGPDRNSYYHEKFLRGLPHLSKGMKRPGVAEKKVADPTQEPDFYAISKIHSLPEKIEEDESILLQCTLQGGPRARVPIYSGAFGALTAASLPKKSGALQLPPRDQSVLDSFQQPVAASESMVHLGRSHTAMATTPSVAPPASLPLPSYLSAVSSSPGFGTLHHSGMGTLGVVGHRTSTLSALETANQLSLQPPPPAMGAPVVAAAALNASTAASQFAAGFAAATAFSQHQFRNILDTLAHEQQQHPPQNHHLHFPHHPNPNGGFNNGFPPSRFR